MSWAFYTTTSFLKSSKIDQFNSEKYDFMNVGGRIGFLAAIFDLRQNNCGVAQERFSNSVV